MQHRGTSQSVSIKLTTTQGRMTGECPISHPRGNHTQKSGKCLCVNTQKWKNKWMSQPSPCQGFTEDVLWNKMSVISRMHNIRRSILYECFPSRNLAQRSVNAWLQLFFLGRHRDICLRIRLQRQDSVLEVLHPEYTPTTVVHQIFPRASLTYAMPARQHFPKSSDQ